MKKIYTVAKYAKSIMLAAVMTASALTTVNAQEENSNSTDYSPASESTWLKGEQISDLTEAYIYNVGAEIFIKNNRSASKRTSTMPTSGLSLTKMTLINLHVEIRNYF